MIITDKFQGIKHKVIWYQATILSFILVCLGLVIIHDHFRLKRDFHSVKTLLMDVRYKAIVENRQILAGFGQKGLVVTDKETEKVYAELKIPTLHVVNYDTTLGEDMIIFTRSGTLPYNMRVHGGDLILKSWLGFEKNIAVNCTGLVTEGTYPLE